jgi:hypothetical protein
MADVFQFEIDETHTDSNIDADDNDELILDNVSDNYFSLLIPYKIIIN